MRTLACIIFSILKGVFKVTLGITFFVIAVMLGNVPD